MNAPVTKDILDKTLEKKSKKGGEDEEEEED